MDSLQSIKQRFGIIGNNIGLNRSYGIKAAKIQIKYIYLNQIEMKNNI